MVSPASLLGQHFWITCYATLALGFVVPLEGELARLLVPPSLFSILFFTALGRDTAELTAALAGRRLLLAVVLATLKMVVLPLIVLGLCALFAPAWSTALVLVAALPAGMSSPTIAGLHRPTAIAAALACVLLTSLVAPLTVPWLLDLSGGKPTGAGSLGLDQARYVAILLGVPWVLSRLVRRWAPSFVATHDARFRPIAVASLAILVYVAAATCRAALVSDSDGVGFLGLAMVTGLSVVLAAFSLAVGERLPGDEAVAFPAGVIFMNNGLGVAMAARFFPDDARVLIAAALIEVPILFGVHVAGRTAARRATIREQSKIVRAHSRVDRGRTGH